jgi:hypothetical protein
MPDLISEGVCACVVLRFWRKVQSYGFNRLVRERERDVRPEERGERRENIFSNLIFIRIVTVELNSLGFSVQKKKKKNSLGVLS